LRDANYGLDMDTTKILMVCLGNICRSPLAEGILRSKLMEAGIKCEVDSAGTGNWHHGEKPHPLSQKVAAINQIDISNQRARQFRADDLDRFDRIYFMDNDNLADAKRIAGKHWKPNKTALLLDILPKAGLREVPDPYFGEFEGYIKVYQLIAAACDAIVEDLRNFAGPV
jgi:protein-tyrosine phosphatase